jgi:hypothetical protein
LGKFGDGGYPVGHQPFIVGDGVAALAHSQDGTDVAPLCSTTRRNNQRRTTVSKQITITLSDEQLAQLASIHSTRKDRTIAEIIDLVVERGIYTLAYRTKHNRKVYAERKQEMQEFRAFKASQK